MARSEPSLEGKVAVITGGATGIGAAAARALGDAGARVVLASRSQAEGESLAAALRSAGIEARFQRTDVTREASVEAMVAATLEHFDRIDCLFNNAGVEGACGRSAVWSERDCDRVLAVNVKGVFLCMKHAAGALAKTRGAVVNTSSVLGTIPFPDGALYAASKAAVLSLTRSMAAELADAQIRVYALCPGIVDTPMIDRVAAAAGVPKTAFAERLNQTRALIDPAVIGRAVRDLFTGKARFESGDAILALGEGLARYG